MPGHLVPLFSHFVTSACIMVPNFQLFLHTCPRVIAILFHDTLLHTFWLHVIEIHLLPVAVHHPLPSVSSNIMTCIVSTFCICGVSENVQMSYVVILWTPPTSCSSCSVHITHVCISYFFSSSSISIWSYKYFPLFCFLTFRWGMYGWSWTGILDDQKELGMCIVQSYIIVMCVYFVRNC